MDFKNSIDVVQFNLRSYRIELLWAITTFVIFTYLMFQFRSGNWYLQWSFLRIQYFPLPVSTIKSVLWILFYLITLPIIILITNSMRRGTDYEFKIEDWPDMWIFQGGSKINTPTGGLEVKHSASGCLFRKYYWKDFDLNFEMRFLQDDEQSNPRSMGILFRGINLENYFMLELRVDIENGDLYVKPHIRLFGKWEFVDWEKVGTVRVIDFLRIHLRVRDRLVKFYLDDSLKYEWTLPDRIDFRGDRQPRLNEEKDKDIEKSGQTVLPISFLNKYGMIGFRADWGQGATIKDIRVATLSQIDRAFLSIFR